MTFNLKLGAPEILALDAYFTYRIGYIGHEDETDETMHRLAKLVAKAADDVRAQQMVLEVAHDTDPGTPVGDESPASGTGHDSFA